MDARRSSSLTQILSASIRPRLSSVAGHGGDRRSNPGNADWQCDLIGREVVDGRETVSH
jgi:hypothetical protein